MKKLISTKGEDQHWKLFERISSIDRQGYLHRMGLIP